MDLETEESVAQFFGQLLEHNKNLKKLKVSLFGGEPLLMVDCICRVIGNLNRRCKEKGIEFRSSIVTNGLFLTKQIAKKLSSICSLKKAQVTIDGLQESYCRAKQAKPEEYQQALQNIVDCAGILDITVRINVDEKNHLEAERLAEYLINDCKLSKKIAIYMARVHNYIGLSEIKNDTCLDDDRFFEMQPGFNQFLKSSEVQTEELSTMPIRKATFCGLCRNGNLVIGPLGEFYRCEHFLGRKDYIIGTCKHGRFYGKNDMAYVEIGHFDECITCSCFPLCLSGCPQERVSLQKNIVNCKEFIKSVKQQVKNVYMEGSTSIQRN